MKSLFGHTLAVSLLVRISQSSCTTLAGVGGVTVYDVVYNYTGNSPAMELDPASKIEREPANCVLTYTCTTASEGNDLCILNTVNTVTSFDPSTGLFSLATES